MAAAEMEEVAAEMDVEAEMAEVGVGAVEAAGVEKAAPKPPKKARKRTTKTATKKMKTKGNAKTKKKAKNPARTPKRAAAETKTKAVCTKAAKAGAGRNGKTQSSTSTTAK